MKSGHHHSLALILITGALSACTLPVTNTSSTPMAIASPSPSVALSDAPFSDLGMRATDADFEQRAITCTNRATDLAIQGFGLFILSREPEPKTFDSLIFSRNGSFHFDFVPDEQVYKLFCEFPFSYDSRTMASGYYRLRDQNGLYVMGIRGKTLPCATPTATKEVDLTNLVERASTPSQCSDQNEAFKQLFASWGDYGEGLSAITIPYFKGVDTQVALNLDFDANLAIEANGMLMSGDTIPQDIRMENGKRLDLVRFVVLASFTSPDCLIKTGPSTFRYDWRMGAIFAGVPATGKGRIGSHNSLFGGNLEILSSPPPPHCPCFVSRSIKK